jgi:hypothetical protein
MDAIGMVLTVLVVALLWVAAVAFGRDTRDRAERSASDRRERLLRL